MEKPKIICWDLDETLGFFRDLTSARNGLGFPSTDDSYTLRKDIIKTLNRLLDKGYRHVVTSSAKQSYTERVLHAVCLDAYFEQIFGRKIVTDGIWGKKYLPAAELFKLNDDEAISNMLIVANMPSDEPVDIPIVFIFDKRPIEESALTYETMAETLWKEGEGSFTRGFEVFFESGRKISCLDKEFDFTLVSTSIADGITVDMGYKNSPREEGLKIPIIQNIRTS